MSGTKIPSDSRVHLIPDGKTCGEGEEGCICVVYYGEHRPLTLTEAKAWRDALDDSIREVESND